MLGLNACLKFYWYPWAQLPVLGPLLLLLLFLTGLPVLALGAIIMGCGGGVIIWEGGAIIMYPGCGLAAMGMPIPYGDKNWPYMGVCMDIMDCRCCSLSGVDLLDDSLGALSLRIISDLRRASVLLIFFLPWLSGRNARSGPGLRLRRCWLRRDRSMSLWLARIKCCWYPYPIPPPLCAPRPTPPSCSICWKLKVCVLLDGNWPKRPSMRALDASMRFSFFLCFRDSCFSRSKFSSMSMADMLRRLPMEEDQPVLALGCGGGVSAIIIAAFWYCCICAICWACCICHCIVGTIAACGLYMASISLIVDLLFRRYPGGTALDLFSCIVGDAVSGSESASDSGWGSSAITETTCLHRSMALVLPLDTGDISPSIYGFGACCCCCMWAIKLISPLERERLCMEGPRSSCRSVDILRALRFSSSDDAVVLPSIIADARFEIAGFAWTITCSSLLSSSSSFDIRVNNRISSKIYFVSYLDCGHHRLHRHR